ncbi:MAG TPA: type IX secretion system sortase PorU [Bacteroidales bacterium]|nr:type IX secretion system sortase PorU [Bacteroidales bacterium]HSA43188.1 type IX secretion system sortase PorU [Bacteroidales bacterium]
MRKFHIVSIIHFLLLFPATHMAFSRDAFQLPPVSIHWLGIQSFGDTSDPLHRFLYFEQAVFQPATGDLPCYSISIPYPAGTRISAVSLLNPVYTELSPEERSVVRDLSLIGNEPMISFEHSVHRKEHAALITILPFIKDQVSGSILRLDQFALELETLPETTETSLRDYAAHSVLSQGTWYKISVSNTGIYRLSWQDLVNMGISPAGINPKNIRIYGNGGGMLAEANNVFRHDDLVENAIVVSGENDGSFDAADYILFYGESPDTWTYKTSKQAFSHTKNLYTDHTYYFLTFDHGPGKRVVDIPQSGQTATHQVNRFNDYAFYELDESNLIKSGKIWYGEKFDLKTSYELPAFSFPNIDGDIPVKFEVDLAARSTSASTFKVYVNGGEAINQQISPISPAFNTDYAIPATASRTFYLNTPTVNVRVNYIPPVTGSIGWLNYVEFNVTRHLIMHGDQMSFRHIESADPGNITEFTLSGVAASTQVWDVTDCTNPGNVLTTGASGNLVFSLPTDSIREFIAFSGASFLGISGWEQISNQDLHATGTHDMIIIAHPDFLNHAHELAEIHRDEGLTVTVTTPGQIYNEFSSGAQDVAALRDFIKMIYDRAPQGQEPRYVLMFGDGSFDYRDRLANNTNFVPTFQSINSLRPTESYVTDDFFGLMDPAEGNDCYGTLDLGVGRLPVKNLEQADQALLKIKKYLGLIPQTPGTNYSNSVPRLGDWRNLICFVADDEDNNMHFDQAEALATYVDTAFREYNVDKIYFDAYKQQSTPGGQRYPDVNADINKRVGKGALIMNYTGHGGETGWAHERVLEVSDINAWNNEWDLPVFVTATCEFSRFDDPERISAGEYVFLNPAGGGISLFTTTRLSFSSSNFALNMNFYYHVFNKTGGRYLKMGEVIKLAKTPSNPYIRNFVLLGDPALGIVYPEYKVATSTINGKPVGTEPDTLKAFSHVTITGYIHDDDGNKLTDFNGVIYPSVFDKPAEVVTLGNDQGSAKRMFLLQKNILYRGKASVTNGEFSFTFIVPRDIAYKYGFGKISYYAQNGITDANGHFDHFLIGGSETNFEADNEGPGIRLYMNDTTFVFGGMTDQNPILLAYLTDFHGINTVGNGIGHDIVAVLDEETDKSIVLNDYYEASLDSYQSGVVRYPFSGLKEGLHTLRLKAWDIYNNSSEAYTEFIVMENDRLVIENLVNYPNPFIDHTCFVFNHNQPGTELEVEIQVYSVTGSLVRVLKTRLLTDGFKAGPILWDGLSEQGARLNRGMYVYRLHVRTSEGENYNKTAKLIVLK